MDAKELFNQPPPEPAPTPVPDPAPAVEPQSAPAPAPVVDAPAPVAPQADHFGKVLQDTMEALKVIDPTGGLADQVREVRRQGVDYYRPRTPNGQFAPQPVQQPQQPLEPVQPRYISELTVDEWNQLQTQAISRQISEAQQQAAYDSAISSEHQKCLAQLESLATPRQTWDEAGKPVFVPAIPKGELEAAKQEALKYRIDTSVPGGATAYTRLVLTLWNANRLSKPNGGLQTQPNPTANTVLTPAPGSPSMPASKSPERQRQEEMVDRMASAQPRSARQLFSKQA